VNDNNNENRARARIDLSLSSLSLSPARQVTDADKAVLQLKTQRRQLAAQRTRVRTQRACVLFLSLHHLSPSIPTINLLSILYPPFSILYPPFSHTQLDALIAREDGLARAALTAKIRPAALTALRRKRLLTQQVAGVDAYADRVEGALATLDAAARSAAVFGALRAGADALTELQSSLPLEAIGRLAEDSAAAREYEERLAAALAASPSAAADEEAAREELAALEASLGAAEAATLPTVPGHAVAGKSGEEEEERMPAVPGGEVEVGDAGQEEAPLAA